MAYISKYDWEYYEPYINLAQSITELAINDYKKVPTEDNLKAVESCLDVFYNFSTNEINNIIARINHDKAEQIKKHI